MPQDLVAQDDHIVCGKCSREIYVKKNSTAKMKCPKCGAVGDSKEFNLAKSCCQK
jgi:predicted RNA-binding Zn-ribbon protein involved in translation (DUF1610 family)